MYYITEGENIRLERDEKEADKDDYGRLLRYVFLEKNQKMINELMLYTGLADFRYLSREARYYDRLEKAVWEAEEKKHGLWIFNLNPKVKSNRKGVKNDGISGINCTKV